MDGLPADIDGLRQSPARPFVIAAIALAAARPCDTGARTGSLCATGGTAGPRCTGACSTAAAATFCEGVVRFENGTAGRQGDKECDCRRSSCQEHAGGGHQRAFWDGFRFAEW
jgi:hypothetical protein